MFHGSAVWSRMTHKQMKTTCSWRDSNCCLRENGTVETGYALLKAAEKFDRYLLSKHD